MVWKRNGLSPVLLGSTLLFMAGQALSGQHACNDELRQQGLAPPMFWDYLQSGHFIGALFENWESELLRTRRPKPERASLQCRASGIFSPVACPQSRWCTARESLGALMNSVRKQLRGFTRKVRLWERLQSRQALPMMPRRD